MSIPSCGLGEQPARLLYSAAEVEQMLGISHATLYRLIALRQLDAIKIGAATRVTAASIQRFLAAAPPVGA